MPSSDAAGTGEFRRYLQTKTFGSLDGLRAAAIIAVLWHHAATEAQPLRILARGFLGVDLFFVISGFLIVTLLLRERRRTGDISLTNFYARRVLRIFPPYYAMLIAVALLVRVTHGDSDGAIAHDLPYAIFYVSNLVSMKSLLGITWSLAAEEQFYLVVPMLERRASRFLPALLPVLYVLLTLPTFGLFPQLALPGFFRQTTFGPILLGVGLAHVLDHPQGFAVVFRWLGRPFAPVVLGLVTLVLCSLPPDDISGLPRLLIHFALVLLVGSCVVREDHALAKLLTLKLVRRLGFVSYGIYLFHMLVRHVVDKVMHRLAWSSDLVFFLAITVGSWLVAEASYRWYESKVLKLKARFSG